MALDLTPEQKATGTGNFNRVVGKLAGADQHPFPTRRDFMKGLIGGAAALPLTAAAYYGYNLSSVRGRPVRAGLIGCGDEGGVLTSEHNPEFVNIVAVSDIRPTNLDRIFVGEGISSRRKGLNYFYGGNSRRNEIKIHEKYQDLLDDPNIEMVIIALPLNLHYRAVMDALAKKKHVLCEKLMAWSIQQCKEMIREADKQDCLLSIGHQRHYSMLYAHANEVVQSGVLGDIRHIRALWHRNNTNNPRQVTEGGKTFTAYGNDGWRKEVPAADRQALSDPEKLRAYGWDSVEQLIRWRLFRRTGGGLMAELGSHQLDACSIFLGKKHPLSVTGIGGKHFYDDEREVEDHVYCTFEFPGKNYDPRVRPRDESGNCQHNDIVTVTYSSVSTNGFESYGECVMGSRGTMVVEREQAAYLYGLQGRSTEVTATTAGGRPALDASASTAPAEKRAGDVGAASVGSNVSYGYREEMEHLAYLIRNREGAAAADRANMKPRCDGRAAMADAIMALTSNIAMRLQRRVDFKEEWYDASKDDTPERDLLERNT